MLAYTKYHGSTALRTINTTQKHGGRLHREGIYFWGQVTVAIKTKIQF